ncbi:MAG: BCCT family transporter [Clostridiales bacterium]
MKKKTILRTYGKVDYPIFLVSVLCSTVFYLPMVLFQEQMAKVIPNIMHIATFSLDWVFELVCFGSLIFSLWLMLGKFGKVKLGEKEDKPEFKTFTWIAMFFCAGIGAGAIYWACIEPLSIMSAPPFGVEALSPQARQWSLTYACFHWSITPWSIFAVPAIAFAYIYYNRGVKFLRPSYACSGILGKHAYGIWGKVIDVFVIVGLLGGLATSLGFVFPMLAGLIADYLNIKNTFLLQAGVGLIFTVIFAYSCYRGLYSGIAQLSNINMVLFIGMIIFIFLAGPSLWLISNFFESIALMLQNYIRMSFYMDTTGGSGFPQNWTVFYWAWWLSWAIYIGLFMARISKGRTLRGFIANMLFTAGGGTAIIFAIIGGYSQHVFFDLAIDLLGILENIGGHAVISAILNTLPFAKIFIPIFIIVLIIAQATGLDSAAYTLANISCKEIEDGQEPPQWIRLFWAVTIFLATMALLMVGGMEAVKLSAVLTSVPLLALQVIFMLSIIRWLRQDFGKN